MTARATFQQKLIHLLKLMKPRNVTSRLTLAATPAAPPAPTQTAKGKMPQKGVDNEKAGKK